MVHFREGIFKNYDFCNWEILEMVQSLWTEASEPKNNVIYKYYWWRFNFKKQLIKVLKERWTNDLPDFELFKINIEELRSNFDPRNSSYCELYLEKLVRIKDELKKKELIRHRQRKKIYPYVKPFCF